MIERQNFFPRGFSVRIYQLSEMKEYKDLCENNEISYNPRWRGTTFYYGMIDNKFYSCSSSIFGKKEFKNIKEFSTYLQQFGNSINKPHELWS